MAEVFKKLNPGGGGSGCLTPVDRDPGSGIPGLGRLILGPCVLES